MTKILTFLRKKPKRTILLATYKAKLKKNRVRVLSARENIAGDASGVLMEAVLEGMAEYFNRELSQKVKRGMELNAQKGLYTGSGVPLGYKVVDKKFEIDSETAPVATCQGLFNYTPRSD